MAILDWSQCPAVESIPGKVSGAWVFKDTRLPISVIFKNLEYGSNIEEIMENYRVSREQIQAILEFAARSAASPVPVDAMNRLDASYFDQRAARCVEVIRFPKAKAGNAATPGSFVAVEIRLPSSSRS